ncbi:MAG: zinc-dependent metalloprotease [Chitinophagales bacterium]|nr:zinc-dependent metalloprotease [Chitinophagales bacterium]
MKHLLLSLFIFCVVTTTPANTNDKGKKNEAVKKDTVPTVVAPTPKKEEPAFKPIAEVTKKCKKIDGLFPIYQDTVTGKSFIEISEDKLGKLYIYFKSVSDGVLTTGFFRGAYRDTKILKINKYFDKLEFSIQNTAYYYDPENALSKAANANINNAIITTLTISGMTQDTSGAKAKRYLVDADKVFLQETLSQIKPSSRQGETPFNAFNLGALSVEKTKYSSIKNYPQNTDVFVEYVYDNKYPSFSGGEDVTDPRSVSVKIQHSIIAVPENDFKPRFEDPRVGYFTEQITDMTTTSAVPYRDVIDRWHLVKKNPELAISEPVEPIVWWMENTTPIAFRPIIKEAVESWNIAFEQAGFKNAVVCYEQPDTADWDAGDIRYNVIRWTSSPQPPFGGYGPSLANPLTGQILGADIMLEYVYFTNRLRQQELFDLVALDHFEDYNTIEDAHFCQMGEVMHQNLLYGNAVLEAYDFSQLEKDEFLKQTLFELVMHEVGHTFGLNHNFIASMMNNMEQVQDEALGRRVGLSASVMDYKPTNISSDKNKQGLFYDVRPGPYDIWAIQYGYLNFDNLDAEKQGLNQLLMKSTQPELRFFNDADDMRSPGKGMDPRIMLFDHSSNPVAYATMQFKMADSVMNVLKTKMIKDGQSYQALRNAYLILTGTQGRALTIISKQIGGVYMDRSFPEQKSTTKPFTPVAYADQKNAMKTVIDLAFSKNALNVPGDLANYLQMQRRGFSLGQGPQDPQILERTLNIQKGVFDHVLNGEVLDRIVDSETYGNKYVLSEMLSDLTEGIFKEDLTSNISIKRQNLQIEYTNRLLKLFITEGNTMPAVKSQVLAELNKIKKWMEIPTGDATTSAHRKYILFLIKDALEK